MSLVQQYARMLLLMALNLLRGIVQRSIPLFFLVQNLF